MSRSIRRVVLAAGAVLLLAACAPTAPPAGTTESGAPAPARPDPGFRLRIALTLMPVTMDPHASIGLNQTRFGVYESLVMLGDDGKLVPGVASEWRSLTPTTWQFKLAANRAFHDGSPLTAQDVKFSIDRAMDPDLRFPTLPRIITFDRVEVVDHQTVTVVTKAPDPLFLKRIVSVSIVQERFVKQLGDKEFALKGMGTGPYMQREFSPQDTLVLVPNPRHPVQPFASEVIVRQVVEASARVAGLRTGEIDLADSVGVDQADTLKAAGIQLIPFEGMSLGAMLFATNEGQAIQSREVRQALNYAVDKETIARTIYKGLTRPTAQLVPPSVSGHNPNLKPYPYDPAKARQLLAQAGYPSGLRMKMDNVLSGAENRQALVAVQQYLRDIGIDLEIFNTTDVAYFLDKYHGRSPRNEMLATVHSPVLDSELTLAIYSPAEQPPVRRYNNSEFGAVLAAASVEMNEQRRTELLHRAAQIMYDDPPFLFLVETFNLWAANPKIQGLRSRIDGEPNVPSLRRAS